ncbi:hypothetical protein QWZ13_05635 [Reinekea marina]|nr:hypothetical protein [Reinekea marina]MDN3648387.1 hypothetical protein [Reinekea marina]
MVKNFIIKAVFTLSPLNAAILFFTSSHWVKNRSRLNPWTEA